MRFHTNKISLKKVRGRGSINKDNLLPYFFQILQMVILKSYANERKEISLHFRNEYTLPLKSI